MKETIENKMDLIGFKYETVQFAVALCYGKKINEQFEFSFYKELLEFADKYDMQKIVAMIEAALKPLITYSNAVEMSNFAILFNASNLRQSCFDFILDSVNSKNSLSNIDQLDKDFAFQILQQSFYRISETVEKQFYN
uniref:Uncharacterized protein n=1 Tax=Panagrolaimus sp. ES5 TaxID=591445 RepID=A0AC34FNS0_9BILA